MSGDKYPSIFSRQMATIVYILPNFQNCARCEKDLKDNKDNSRHLARKYARIFVLGHYLFLVRSRRLVRHYHDLNFRNAIRSDSVRV